MRWSGVVGAGLVVLAVGGCGGTARTHRVVRRLPVVPVSYDGQSCAPGWAALKPGAYEFMLQDRGSDAIALTLLNASAGTAVSATTPVSPGARATVRAQLRPGTSYEWRCQTPSQAAATSAQIEVAGTGVAASREAPADLSIVSLYQPEARYTRYAAATLARLRRRLGVLDRRLRAGNLAGARSAWVQAHVSWLAIGQDDGAYGAFGDLGNQIDGTADGDVGTTSSRHFTGFHRVELDLWRHHDLRAARADAATLTKLVDSIDAQVLSQDLPPTTVALDSWVLRGHEILEDALRDTLSGNDDYGSHTDLATIGADVTASREMLQVLRGLIEARAPRLVPTATRQLAALDAAIRPAVSVPIAALPPSRRQRIDAALDGALETLAPVSELLQISSANS